MKPTETFIRTIGQMLEAEAGKDALFAEKLKNGKKSMEECCRHILSEVRKSGFSGFADEEILGMAKHYWDEDDIKVPDSHEDCKVVVNRHIELTEEEKREAKDKALRELVEAEKRRMTEKRAKPSARKEEANQPTLF